MNIPVIIATDKHMTTKSTANAPAKRFLIEGLCQRLHPLFHRCRNHVDFTHGLSAKVLKSSPPSKVDFCFDNFTGLLRTERVSPKNNSVAG
jgi:hypothetical protein